MHAYRCSEGGWCLVEGMSKPHQEPCETCKFRKAPRVKKELFRSTIYPWESDEEDSPYFYYCPRGRVWPYGFPSSYIRCCTSLKAIPNYFSFINQKRAGPE